MNVMNKIEIDELNLYRGREHVINKYISIKVPTLGEICDYGESKYYSMIHTLCSVGIDLCWQLEEMGIKFDEITDYELFVNLLCRGYDTDQTKILFGEKLNFQKMLPYIKEEDNSIFLVQKYLISVPLKTYPYLVSDTICQVPNGSNIVILNNINDNYYKINYDGKIGYIMKKYVCSINDNYFICDTEEEQISNDAIYDAIIIDENVYCEMVTYLRSMHNLKRDDRIAGSSSCRRAFIEDAKMEYEAKQKEPFKSILLPMISTLVNIEGFKRNDTNIWDMNIYSFMDSVKRINKIRNSTLLLQSGYSGFGINLKELKNKDELNYMGELN